MAVKSDRRGRILIFLPVLNESETVAGLTTAIRELGSRYETLVVDDGSRPALEFDEPGLFVRLPENFGLGVSTHIAIDHALRFGYSTLVRIDSDGQHSVSDIPRLVARIDQGDADAVLGHRLNHRPTGWWDLRAWLKSYFSLIGKLASRGGTPVDMNSGFLALNERAMKAINAHELERYPEPQIFFLAHRAGLKIAEVEVQQERRKHGNSSIRLFSALRLFIRFNVIILSELLRTRR